MGITILAVLAGIGGVLGAVGGIAAFAVGTVAFGLSGAIFGIALLALAALSLAFAVGALQMKPWAWPLGMVMALAQIAFAAVWIVGGGDLSSNVITIAIYGAVVFYLNQPTIKAAFGR